MLRMLNQIICFIAFLIVTSLPTISTAATTPGTVLSVKPINTYVAPLIKIPAKAWKISYSSTNATGVPTIISGTVLVPQKPWTGTGPRPLVGYAIGTQGLADRCAPSTQLANGTEYEASLIALALEQGWAIALTDYPGLGTPGEHPYVVGKALGYAVLDAMRAARSLSEAGISPNAPLGIFGYSEGGMAAGWALQLQPTYAPDLPLVAGAAGAAPANLIDQLSFNTNTPFSFLILYAAIGFDAAYPELNLDGYLTPLGRSTIAKYKNSCIVDAGVLAQLLPKSRSAYVVNDPTKNQLWINRLRENSLGSIAPKPPVIVGGGDQDFIISNAQQRELYKKWCSLGTNAHYADILLGEHVTAAPQFALAAFPFLSDRFAGKPLPKAEDCQ